MRHVLALTLLGLTATLSAADKDELFTAKPLTEKNSFTPGIEGPCCDAAGNLFVVNLKLNGDGTRKNGDIAVIAPGGKPSVYIDLPEKSVGNGIVFDTKGFMYVADYTGHNVLKIDPKTKAVAVFAHEPTANQPNDLAIAPNGTLYASDPNWAKGTGQLWKVATDGKFTKVAADMGTTNGIDVSPDGKTLYVNESVQRNVWSFPIQADGTLGEKKLLKKFDDHGFDGMRCDVDGNLYITRYGAGTVVKMSPDGKILKEIDVLGKKPSNICFGGPDGRTAYVTEVEFNRVVTFRVDRPGLAWARLHAKETGTVELFNGKDLTGWGYVKGATFEGFDGKTESSDKRYSAKDGVLVVNPGKGLNQLWTAAKFPTDFELRLEFRAGVNADSGLFVRGPQLQVRDYLVAGPYKDLKKYKPQDWNEIVVVVRGEVAHCTCNGEVLNDKMKVPATGPIGLEADRGQMEYRNIRLKELKP
ncbi:SMP-30/gluconolactonase/LRE family protein [Gemmata sp. JC717]|uniref:SMP-30/gluconolactonase/LRE family protein n=1 Tax=Gemmata algarum TaxID=2975278 RepID=UPI0021BA9028|nr:SMP-30/gluconolactonase/LRE family protein [Gemmata algarum]MDY3557234.1 SMP-30/gluconolactonase/LRE family protein [Gemmata algarum]